jgi:MFS family permease
MTASQADGAAVVPTPVYQEKMNTQNVIIFTTLTLGAIASAMVNGIISTTLGQPSFLEYFHLLTSDGSDTAKIGAMLGVFFTGSLFGLYYQGYIADRFGRKKALLNAALFSIFSGALLAGSVHIAMFIVFR